MDHRSFIEEVCRVLGGRIVRSGLDALGVEVQIVEEEVDPVDLEEVRELLGDCRRCKLCDGRKSIVFGEGSVHPRLIVVGEGPGQTEDETGRPFVGQAGQMLDRMLENVLQIGRDQAFITNAVKCRTSSDDRDPEPDELDACMPFLRMQQRVLRPSFGLVLGKVAARSVLGLEGSLRQMRGKWYDWSGVPTMVTYHPAHLLRHPEDKRKAFEDLLMLASRMKE